jgi:hypothetical protein
MIRFVSGVTCGVLSMGIAVAFWAYDLLRRG